MSPVFVDTSAFYAMLDPADASHPVAAPRWHSLLDALRLDPTLAVTHSGVLTESAALIQRRLGMAAVRGLLETLVPSIEVVWIDAELHRLASTALLAAGKRQVSLVDWTSFIVMRERAITHAFSFDDDFQRQGFHQFEG